MDCSHEFKSAQLKGATKISPPFLMEKNRWLDLIDEYSTFVLVLSLSLKQQRKHEVSIVLFLPLSQGEPRWVELKHQKLLLQLKHWRTQRNGVISLIWNWCSPEAVQFVLHMNTSRIRAISHASLFWLVLFINVLSLKVNILQSVVETGKKRGCYTSVDVPNVLKTLN